MKNAFDLSFLFQSPACYLCCRSPSSLSCDVAFLRLPKKIHKLRRNKIINFMHVSFLSAFLCNDICFVSFCSRFPAFSEIETEKNALIAIFSQTVDYSCHRLNGNRPIHILIYRLHGWRRLLKEETACTSYAEFISNANCFEVDSVLESSRNHNWKSLAEQSTE